MLVRVKKEFGNYGHRQNGVLSPRNWKDGAFEVSDAKGQELLSRGVVEAVGAVTAPAAKPAPQKKEAQEPTLEQLRAEARQRGIKGYARLSRSKLLAALESDEEKAPDLNAMEAVE